MSEPLVSSQADLYYQQFLTGCLVVCLAMVILWVWRMKIKGKNAFIMSLAFIVMSFLIYTLKMDFDPLWTKILTIILGLLLLIDMWIRASNYKSL